MVASNQSLARKRVFIQNRPEIPTPERNVEYVPIPGSDRPLTVWDGSYLPVDIELEMVLVASNRETIINEYRSVRQLLDSSVHAPCQFYFDPDYIYFARFSNINRKGKYDYNQALPFSMTMNALPIKRLASGMLDVPIANGTVMYNPELHESLPRILFKGSGNITILVNGIEYIFKGLVDGNYGIDSEIQEVYQITDSVNISINTKYYTHSYPSLGVGENTISWTGNASNVLVMPRWGAVL